MVKLKELNFLWTGGLSTLSGGNLFDSCKFQVLRHAKQKPLNELLYFF